MRIIQKEEQGRPNSRGILRESSSNDWISIADYIINKSYLPQLENRDVVPFRLEDGRQNAAEKAGFFPIKKIVYDKEESTLQKLINVYSCASSANINIAMIIISTEDKGIEIYLGTCDDKDARIKAEILHQVFMGNFPGSRYETENIQDMFKKEKTQEIIDRIFFDDSQNVAAVSGIGSLRGTQGNDENENFIQGMEKVIESVESGKKYSIVILAKSVKDEEINDLREELCEVYSALSPFAKCAMSVGRTHSTTVTESIAESSGQSLSKSASNSFNIGVGRSSGEGHSHHKNYTAGLGFPFVNHMNAGYTTGNSRFENRVESANINRGKSYTEGTMESSNITESKGTANTVGDSRSMQISQENKTITELLGAVDLQLKRLRVGKSFGMFAVSAYFLAPNETDVKILAGAYKSIISGNNTHVSESCINYWKGLKAKNITAYLKHFRHPVFYLNRMETTPAALVSVPELAIHMGLPRKSANQIPVCYGVAFGRNVTHLNGGTALQDILPIGNIFHMGLKEYTKAWLNFESLTMHTFITGTTGSGKSNTVYSLLNNIQKIRNTVKFLVIEPAKGEYKNVFGYRKDVFIYGINPKLTPQLRINPFRFQEDIHILEHLDRLVSIFNVCWPMEAAMPSILKQGIERAYETAGWDLCRSRNRFSAPIFPNFGDVMNEVETILNESQYSDENKGNYIGALCTRLKELTTGLNSMVFVTDDLTDEELFDENVIIDLSRLGASETKSLIMGLVTIRLQEYRQAKQKQMNTPLNHITVLEEAHHLLRRTSGEIGGDLAKKSVEMLTNAFAEMRSAGEGFIIADQAPGLLDMAVIRNTNTKFIMRLPAQEDRELVGRSMGLNDLQIAELSRLPTGVSATYQNDWLSPVLVQLPYFETKKIELYQYHGELTHYDNKEEEKNKINLVKFLTKKNGNNTFETESPSGVVELIYRSQLPTKVKFLLADFLQNTMSVEADLDWRSKLTFELFNFKEVLGVASRKSVAHWKKDVMDLLNPSVVTLSEDEKETVLLLLAREYARRVREFMPMYITLADSLSLNRHIK